MRVKMSKPPPPAPTASAIGPCPTVVKNEGRPGTGSLPSTFAPPDHPLGVDVSMQRIYCNYIIKLNYKQDGHEAVNRSSE